MIVLLLLFTQNKQFMEDMRPALDFLEEHKEAVAVLGQVLRGNAAAETAAPAAAASQRRPPPAPDGGQGGSDTAGPDGDSKGRKDGAEKIRSPLQGIANEAILNGIRSYLSNQPK